MVDIEQFCSALSGGNPAGADLEYDPAFLALEVAQRGKAERQYGDTIIPAEAPDWKQVHEQATALASRTRDLRIACTLTRAWTRMRGLEGLVDGLALIERLCRDLWPHLYPLLDDDGDPTLRMNALAPLAAHDGLLADLRGSVFASARGMGACTIRDVEIALGLLSPSAGTSRVPVIADIDGIVAACQVEGGFQGNLARQAIDLAATLRVCLAERAGEVNVPDLQPLESRLRPIAEYAKKFVKANEVERPADVVAKDDGAAAAALPAFAAGSIAVPSAGAASMAGPIRNRDDVSRLLDLICAYFEQHEPTNPAPLLLRRAQRLSGMNFFDIVRDIAPDALSSVEQVAGPRPET